MLAERAEQKVSLEKVTVWYRCPLCFVYVYSVSELQRHAENEHNQPSVKLPKNLPPGAENGKPYFKYDLPIHKPPPTYPYHPSEEADYCGPECDCHLKRRFRSKESASSRDDTSAKAYLSDSIPSERDYGIRVKQLGELQGDSSSENEEDITRQNQGSVQCKRPRINSPSPPRIPVVSPPDSGIQMHDAGSECQEEEGQKPNVSTIDSVWPRLTAANPSNVPQASSPSTAHPVNTFQGGKIKCQNCDKKFSNPSSLNFHMKKFHQNSSDKLKEHEASLPPPVKDKVILKIQRDTTGNLISSSGGNNKSTAQGEAQAMQNKAKRTEPEPCTDAEDSDSKTVFIPRNKPKPDKQSSSKKIVSPVRKSLRRKTRSLKDASSSESEAEVIRPSRYNRRKSTQILSSPSSPESDFVVPDDSPIVPTKRRLRPRRKSAPKSDSDSSSIPIARKTRARSKIEKSPSAKSHQSESESGSGSSSGSNTREENSEESEGELSDRSTTPEVGIPPPTLTKYGNSHDEDKSTTSKKSENEERNSDASYSTSDSEDLFIAVTVKRKKGSKGNVEKSAETPTVKKDGDDVTVCKVCQKKIKGGLPKYIGHLYERHKDNNDLKFNCGYCNKAFSTKQPVDLFNEHLQKCEEEKKRKQKLK